MPVGSRVIKALDIVRSIRLGMSDGALMERFGLSAQGLQTAFKQLESQGILVPTEMERRALMAPGVVALDLERNRLRHAGGTTEAVRIAASDVLNDIRAGLNDVALMNKYNLSIKGLQSLFTKLVNLNLLDLDDLERSAESNLSSVLLDDEADARFELAGNSEEIKTMEFLDRIEAGTDRESLMDEYDITATDLQGVFRRLVSSGKISQTELERKLPVHCRHFQIIHRTSGEVLYSDEAPSMAAVVAKAVASGVDLSQSDLSGVTLTRAELSGARLERANLRKANLVRADLTGARLVGADLTSADMTGAVLFKANLTGADLSDAALAMVNATWAFLVGANLSESNLTKANLSGANLSDANVFEAILYEANLTGAFLQNVDIQSARIAGAIW